MPVCGHEVARDEVRGARENLEAALAANNAKGAKIFFLTNPSFARQT